MINGFATLPESKAYDGVCTLCGGKDGNRQILAQEMMFGMGGEFRYLHCGTCGVVHLENVPEDLAPYYPASSYYSVYRPPSRLKRALMTWRDRATVNPASWLGKKLADAYPNTALEATAKVASRRDTRILDVGCGKGELLHSLARLGFTSLSGVDPLLDRSREEGGVRLVSGELSSLEEVFDLIMFHHSLEHIREQVDVLRQARRLLAPDGSVLIRVPTSGSLAFRLYGRHWFQLDAPRHLFLHSADSLRRVAAEAGLAVREIYCDSRPAQFWASEMYRDGMPLSSDRLPRYKRMHKRFFRDLSRYANAHAVGDQMVVLLHVPR